MPFLIYISPLAVLHPSGWGPRRAKEEGWLWLISNWLLNAQVLCEQKCNLFVSTCATMDPLAQDVSGYFVCTIKARDALKK